MAAGLGLDATGADLAPSALDTARHKARQRGRTTRFLRHDAGNLADPGESFDTVLGCGLFHVFGDGDRATYAGNLRSAAAPRGRYFPAVLQQQPAARRLGTAAPGEPGRDLRLVRRRVAHRRDRASHDRHHHQPDGIRAWLAALTRT